MTDKKEWWMSDKFDMWNERYANQGYFYGSEPNDFLQEACGAIPKGGSVLCLAEGEGRNAVFLAGLGYAVTAVDGSAQGLAKLQTLANEKGVRVAAVCADLADYDMGVGAWDGIVSIWCHLPNPLRSEVHRKAVAALKPGGVFLLEAYTPKQLAYKTGGPPDVTLLMTLSALRQELSGLQIEHGVEIDRDIQEGRGHLGTSAVVQVLARKP